MTIKIAINNQSIETNPGETILTAALRNGIQIPTLCYHRDLTPTGNCRICVVEVHGQRFLTNRMQYCGVRGNADRNHEPTRGSITQKKP